MTPLEKFNQDVPVGSTVRVAVDSGNSFIAQITQPAFLKEDWYTVIIAGEEYLTSQVQKVELLYRVWVELECVDALTDAPIGGPMDSGFCSTGTFTEEAKAEAFARLLHTQGLTLAEFLKHNKP